MVQMYYNSALLSVNMPHYYQVLSCLTVDQACSCLLITSVNCELTWYTCGKVVHYLYNYNQRNIYYIKETPCFSYFTSVESTRY